MCLLKDNVIANPLCKELSNKSLKPLELVLYCHNIRRENLFRYALKYLNN